MESMEKTFSYLDEYKIIKTLGSGYNAVVKLAQDTKGQLVAIKRYKSQTSDLQTLIDELTIMKNLNQENIVKLIAVKDMATYKRKDGTTYQCLAIILQYCGGGQLFDYVCDTGKFSQKITRTYFHQMMSGLHFLHEKGYAHRDIKPENLLLSHDFKLKLADFGFATLWRGRDGSGILHTKLGTEGYMAPQIYSKNYQGKQTDVFAAGIILFIMYGGCPPFQKTNDTDPYFKLLKAKEFDKFWKYHERRRPSGYFGESFRSVFIHMTAYDPKQRPTIQQIAGHPWVKQQLCTHAQIKAQFLKRKQYLDQVLEIRFKQQAESSKFRLHQISTQSENQNRSEQAESPFLEIYNKEVHMNRKLTLTSTVTKDSLIIREEPQFAISLLKDKLRQLCLSLLSEQENLIQSQPESGNLIFEKIEDSGKDEIFVQYSYKYGTQVQGTQSLNVRFGLGLDKAKNLVVNISKVDGSFFYFRKLVVQIKKGFLNKALNQNQKIS